MNNAEMLDLKWRVIGPLPPSHTCSCVWPGELGRSLGLRLLKLEERRPSANYGLFYRFTVGFSLCPHLQPRIQSSLPCKPFQFGVWGVDMVKFSVWRSVLGLWGL